MPLFGAATLVAAVCAVGVLTAIAWYLAGISNTLTNLLCGAKDRHVEIRSALEEARIAAKEQGEERVRLLSRLTGDVKQTLLLVACLVDSAREAERSRSATPVASGKTKEAADEAPDSDQKAIELTQEEAIAQIAKSTAAPVTVREGSRPPEVSSRSVGPENERPSEAGAATTLWARAPNSGAPTRAEAVATGGGSRTEDTADGPSAMHEVSV